VSLIQSNVRNRPSAARREWQLQGNQIAKLPEKRAPALTHDR
jgi:hypothetical protein